MMMRTAFDSDPQLVGLKHLQSLEQCSASMIRRRAKKVNPAADPPIHWLAALKERFGEPESDRLITSEDGPDGSIDAARIERIARERILEE